MTQVRARKEPVLAQWVCCDDNVMLSPDRFWCVELFECLGRSLLCQVQLRAFVGRSNPHDPVEGIQIGALPDRRIEKKDQVDALLAVGKIRLEAGIHRVYEIPIGPSGSDVVIILPSLDNGPRG